MRNIAEDLTPEQVEHALSEILTNAAYEVMELPPLLIERSKQTEEHVVVRALCARLIAVGSVILSIASGEKRDLLEMCQVLGCDFAELVEEASHA